MTFTVLLTITLLFAVLTYKNPAFIDESLETLLLDYRFYLKNFIDPPEKPDGVVIAAIDEKSLARYGRWPWPRKLQAELIEMIFSDSPRAVAVDIFYPEPESLEADAALAGVMEKYRDRLVIALGFEVEEGLTFEGEMEELLYEHTIHKIRNLELLRSAEAFRVILPPDPIADSATFGHVYSLPDRDGKIRWESLYIKYGDEYFPSFSLQAARVAKGTALKSISIAGGKGIDMDGLWIPTDDFGRLHIKYIGGKGSIEYVSASDVLSGDLAPGYLRDKTVVVGTSAVGTYEQKVSPFSANMPGVEINATVVANIINADFIKRSPLYCNLFAVIAVGLLSMFIGQRKNAIGYFIVLALMIVSLNQAFFTYYSLYINLTYPLLTVLAIGTFLISYRYMVQERKAREIRNTFSSSVTGRVVNELVKNPGMAKIGGDRREMTVLFADIREFAKFSEKHEPEKVVSMLNEYLTVMTDIVFRWEGTLDKCTGDAMVAFWGAPLEQKNHSERAVRCALHMINKLSELREKWISEGREPFSIGIGLNTGEVLVGNIGAEGKKMDYTIIGDQVNIGARVGALTENFDVDILFTEPVFNNIREDVERGRIGHVSIKGIADVVVKGKEKAIMICSVRSLDHDAESVISESGDKETIRMKGK